MCACMAAKHAGYASSPATCKTRRSRKVMERSRKRARQMTTVSTIQLRNRPAGRRRRLLLLCATPSTSRLRRLLVPASSRRKNFRAGGIRLPGRVAGRATWKTLLAPATARPSGDSSLRARPRNCWRWWRRVGCWRRWRRRYAAAAPLTSLDSLLRLVPPSTCRRTRTTAQPSSAQGTTAPRHCAGRPARATGRW